MSLLKGKFVLLDFFKDFHFNSSHPQNPQISKIGSSWLVNNFTDKNFAKLFSSLVIAFKIFTISSDKLDRKRNAGNFFGDILH